MLVDFHLHSLASDGILPPEELIRTAKLHNISMLSLTDHDTILGIEKASETARKNNMNFIIGTELEADIDSVQYCHILAYGMNNMSVLQQYLNELRNARIHRISAYISIFNELGYSISVEALGALTPGRHLTEGHIIKWFLKNSNLSASDIFSKYFSPSSKYFVEKNYHYFHNIIGLIHESGGIAVLAHPFRLRFSESQLIDFVHKLKESNLDGIEAYYGSHNLNQILFCRKIADEFGFITTGGSDWHGWEDTAPIGVHFPNEELQKFLNKLEKHL